MGNVGCLMQVAPAPEEAGADLWVAHTIDALWASYSGELPPANQEELTTENTRETEKTSKRGLLSAARVQLAGDPTRFVAFSVPLCSSRLIFFSPRR